MILFDVQAVQSRAHGERGIARFCFELASAIEARAPGRIDYFVVNPHLAVPDALAPLQRTGRVIPFDDDRVHDVRLLHVGSPVELDRPLDDLFVGRPRRLIVNLFDLIPAVFSQHYLHDPNTAVRYLARLGFYSAADLVLADSQSAASDATRLLGVPEQRLRVIGAGASDRFAPHPGGPSAALADLQAVLPDVREGFVLLPSGIDWRKNIEGVLTAYSRLSAEVRQRHQLVLTCRITDSDRARLDELATSLGCGGTFVMTGFVHDDVLVDLNRAASLVVFPSKYEGFGLPVLEARQCGAPVICGDNSSLREVLPDAAARFDAESTESIHEILERALIDEDFLGRLRAVDLPPFGWDEAARLTLQAYDELLEAPHPSALMLDQRPTIAYVTPLPPVQSGIAEYSYRLLGELARLARVRCFIDQDPATVEVPTGVAVSALSELATRWSVGEFDHVVVALGNNDLHRTAVESLRSVGGVVHLHDVRLTNCYADEPWPAIVEQHYPGRFSSDQLSALSDPWAPAVRDGAVYLLGDVREHADRVFVHSRHAAALVEEDAAVEAVVIGPLGFPDVQPKVTSHTVTLVTSFGIVSPAKQSEKVAGAAARVLARRPEVEFVFVGHGDHLVESVGRVHGTGHVGPTEYRSWLRRTDLAVQLRASSNGESSAAVVDCLAAGVPTIVTDIGSSSELPDDVVVKVPVDISEHDLAELIDALIDDPGRREALSLAAIRFATAHSTADVAARFLHELSRRGPSRANHVGAPTP